MAVQRALIVAVFNERVSAERAIEQLYNAGVASDRISYSGKGAGTAEGGFLESVKNLFGGTHTYTPNDVMHDLANMGLPEDEAQYYSREYATGRTIVAVHPDEHSQDILAILQNSGGYHFHSPEGTGPAAHPRTEADVTENAPGYAQTRTAERTAGYAVNQDFNATPDERRAANETPLDYKNQERDTSSTYNQDVNAPGYSSTQGSNTPLRSTENYGQSDPLRQGGTYEQNVDYSREQRENLNREDI